VSSFKKVQDQLTADYVLTVKSAEFIWT